MALEESDREDILREATALVERAELKIAGRAEAVIIGFRRDGSASLFLGHELVYQFNTKNELRRAFLAGDLIKAEAGSLVRLRRERTANAVHLLRHALSPEEQRSQMDQMHLSLAALRQSLAGGEVVAAAHHPAEADLLPRIRNWLNQLPQNIAIANRPHVA
jgi:hypothetical protein